MPRLNRSGRSDAALLAAAMLGLLSAAFLAQQPAEAAGSAEPAAAAPPGNAATPSAAAAAPEQATATGDAPATIVIARPAAGNGVFLDLNVRAFRPPRHGAVEAVVSLAEAREGGREADVGVFAIFPSKAFNAANAEDERRFRLDATQALADLGGEDAAVNVKVRLSPLRDGESIQDALLTLGKVQLVPREAPK